MAGQRQYTPAQRNRAGIQFEKVRSGFDEKYEAVHDALSAAYYGKKPFSWNGTDYGVLDKATFDTLHALIFHHYDVDFNAHNLKLPASDRIPEAAYAEVEMDTATAAALGVVIIEKDGRSIVPKSALAAARIAAIAKSGLSLKV